MKPTARRFVVLFLVIGLAAAAYALYVHYRLLIQPGYSPPCDINATVNCSQVYLSPYGSFFRVPVALYGVIWWVFVALMTVALFRGRPEVQESISGYLFAVSTVGLAVILYLAYAAFFILKSVCVLCVTTYAAVIGLFLITGIATPFAMTSLPRRAIRDLRALVASPLALVLSIVFLAGTASALAFFPREAARPSAAPPAPEVSPQPAADQVSDFDKWFVSAPRATIPVSNDGAAVLIVKFTDFQCPACGQTYFAYKPVLAKYEAQLPGAVKLVPKNYPLQADCNPAVLRTIHPAACDAAVAFEMARGQKRENQLEEWLYANQQMLTPLVVRQAAATVGWVTTWDAGFAFGLNSVKSDVALGRLLNVRVTPTFFINGVRFDGPLQTTAFFDRAIAIELKRTGKLQ